MGIFNSVSQAQHGELSRRVTSLENFVTTLMKEMLEYKAETVKDLATKDALVNELKQQVTSVVLERDSLLDRLLAVNGVAPIHQKQPIKQAKSEEEQQLEALANNKASMQSLLPRLRGVAQAKQAHPTSSNGVIINRQAVAEEMKALKSDGQIAEAAKALKGVS